MDKPKLCLTAAQPRSEAKEDHLRLRDCKVGMRVRVKGVQDGTGYLVGCEGTIVFKDKTPCLPLAVEFNAPGLGPLHDCLGHVKSGRGFWFDPRNLEPAPAKKGR